jgi:hypothetical protein
MCRPSGCIPVQRCLGAVPLCCSYLISHTSTTCAALPLQRTVQHYVRQCTTLSSPRPTTAPHSYKPSTTPVGGIGFKASPPSIFLGEDVVLRYQVAFDDSFEPVRGGKLPGLFVANGTSAADQQGASGARLVGTCACTAHER